MKTEQIQHLVTPNAKRVAIVRDTVEEVTNAGIYLPESGRGQLNSGMIVSMGDGCPEFLENGCRVTFSGFGGSEITIGDRKILLLHVDDIHCRVDTDAEIGGV
ncbi:MAG: co-chaperone GroES [Pseudomonadales bacterium]|nr:co-chaperone GroES [Pseudomonadales bacterium]MBL4864813.1 co-chaperone GroES [Pseudomonadales bacterium]